jgi:hypothetical protein
MAQHDYIISNQTFPNTRADINNALLAISSNNSGTSAPTTQYAGQFWLDTNTPSSTTWTLYIHDGSDDIQFAQIDTSANTVNFIDSALADDVVINTSGAITTTGAFTSKGIDDNADATAITIDSSENVGIGTASPDTLLSLEKNNAPIIQFKDTSGATDEKIWRVNGLNDAYRIQTWNDALNSNQVAYQILRSGVDVQTHRFYTEDSERMRLTTTGLGIGTSAPTYKLTVQASADNQDLIRLNHPSAATAGAMLGFTTDGTTANNVITLGVQYSNVDFDVLNIQRSTQNVGIGETAPLGKLHVKSGDSGVSSADITDLVVETSSNGGISLLGATNGQVEIAFGDSGDANIGRIAYNNNDNFLATVVNASEATRIHSNGVLSASAGIALGVGTANTASNVLSDYEEGTFTPSFTSGVSGSGYTHQTGRYTKIGNKVFIEIQLDGNGLSGNGDHLKIGNLPFSSIASAPYGAISIGYNAGFVSDGNITIVKGSSNNVLECYQMDGTTLLGNETNNLNQALLISGQYTVA